MTRGRAGRTGFTATDLDAWVRREAGDSGKPEGARFGGWAADLDGNGDGEVDATELDAAPDEVLQRLALEAEYDWPTDGVRYDSAAAEVVAAATAGLEQAQQD